MCITYTHICICICICIYVCVCIYIYIYLYIIVNSQPAKHMEPRALRDRRPVVTTQVLASAREAYIYIYIYINIYY